MREDVSEDFELSLDKSRFVWLRPYVLLILCFVLSFGAGALFKS